MKRTLTLIALLLALLACETGPSTKTPEQRIEAWQNLKLRHAAVTKDPMFGDFDGSLADPLHGRPLPDFDGIVAKIREAAASGSEIPSFAMQKRTVNEYLRAFNNWKADELRK